MNKYFTAAALLFFLVPPSLAVAQPPGFARLQTVIRTLDADNDQSLSTDEVQQATQRLLSLDSNSDGALSLEEMGGPAPGSRNDSAAVRHSRTGRRRRPERVCR